MANIPDQTIIRSLEYMVQRDGQFDDPETSPQMAAGDRYIAHGLVANIIGKTLQLSG